MEQVCNLDWKNIQGEKKLEILEQAKAMHKEEIMEAHYAPQYRCFSIDYYNETFGGNNENNWK